MQNANVQLQYPDIKYVIVKLKPEAYIFSKYTINNKFKKIRDLLINIYLILLSAFNV